MRQRSDIRDLFHDDTRGVDGADSGLTALSRTLNIHFHSAKTQIVGHLRTVLSHHLGCVGSVFLRTSVTHLTSGRPGNHLTIVVGEGNDNVIEGSIDKRLTLSLDSNNSLLR